MAEENSTVEPDWLQRWREAETRPHRQEPTSPFDEFDALGRKVPRRLGVPDYLLFIARLEPDRVRRVPAVAIEEEGTDESGEFAFVNCPCGKRPIAKSALEKCGGCERSYVCLAVGAVWVAYGEMAPPPLVV